jgi:hypothetical protein
MKPESSFNQVMKPLVYSKKEADREDGTITDTAETQAKENESSGADFAA